MTLNRLSTYAFIISLNALVFIGSVFAHGEDRYGPHGGFVRMPGALHTEVVKKNSNILVYLLDVAWKNPTTVNSSVEASIRRKGQDTSLVCQVGNDNFICSLPKNEKLKSGELVVKATRDKVVGGPATYPLPLNLIKTTDAHEGHH